MSTVEVVGITGSRKGLTDEQRLTLESRLHALYNLGARTLHHGDCVGVDAQAAEIAQSLGYRLVSHPPLNDSLRAYVESDSSWTPKDYLDRDRDIVDSCDYLIGCPDGPRRQRSGTWYTLNYAEEVGTSCLIIRPDGSAWMKDPDGEWVWGW